ncbi:perlucin-like protein [Mercenaria mercenaria]|uniref:perlucin-like protein n=1 Tax=Mercenaria mercenaria TaxID=6596 RepID=UPI00234EC20B|nr:perlucin-like protein [Mercenaria mercenaria]
MLVFLQNKLTFLENKVCKDEKSEQRIIEISDKVEILNISQKETTQEVDELKQQNAENKVNISELFNKLEHIQGKFNKMNGAAFLECGAWERVGFSCYKFFDEEVEWEVAVQNCKLEDAYLIEIDSSIENTFAVNIVNQTKTRNVTDTSDSKDGNSGPWLGASDKQTEGNWVWEYSGRYLNRGFQGWHDREPNGKSRENCLHLLEKQDYKWNDTPCARKNPYVCEKPVTVK